MTGYFPISVIYFSKVLCLNIRWGGGERPRILAVCVGTCRHESGFTETLICLLLGSAPIITSSPLYIYNICSLPVNKGSLVVQSPPQIHSVPFINQCDKSWSQTGDGFVLRHRYMRALIKACVRLRVGVNIAHAVCLIVSMRCWTAILPRWKAPACLYECWVAVNQWECDWGEGAVWRGSYRESQTLGLSLTLVFIFKA